MFKTVMPVSVRGHKPSRHRSYQKLLKMRDNCCENVFFKVIKNNIYQSQSLKHKYFATRHTANNWQNFVPFCIKCLTQLLWTLGRSYLNLNSII